MLSPVDVPWNSQSIPPPSPLAMLLSNVFIVLRNELLVDAPMTVINTLPAAPALAVLVSNSFDSNTNTDVVTLLSHEIPIEPYPPAVMSVKDESIIVSDRSVTVSKWYSPMPPESDVASELETVTVSIKIVSDVDDSAVDKYIAPPPFLLLLSVPRAFVSSKVESLISMLDDTTEPEYTTARPPPDTSASLLVTLLRVKISDEPPMRDPATNSPIEPPSAPADDWSNSQS
jgi:hypothetical protein